MSNQRIQFLDLAKGICILLVIVLHCGYIDIRSSNVLCMPLFFIVSGMFISVRSGFSSFVIKKINRLLVPVFALAIPTLIIRHLLFHDINIHTFYYWSGHNKTTVSLWFLIVLFQSSVMYGLLCQLIKKNYLLTIASFLIGVLGYVTIFHFELSSFLINRSLIALPLLHIGHQLNVSGKLHASKWDQYISITAVISFVTLCLLIEYTGLNLDMRSNTYTGNTVLLFLTIIGLAISFLFVCKTIKHIPFISYVGKHSIVILCIHGFFIEFIDLEYVRSFLHLNECTPLVFFIIKFIFAVSMSSLCIPIALRYFPKVFGQKDVFTCEDLKLFMKSSRNKKSVY